MSSLCPVSVFCGHAWGELSSVQCSRMEAPLGAGAPTDSKYPALNQSTPEVCNLWILGKDLTKPSIQPFFELCLVSSFSYSFSSAHPLLCVSSVSPHLSSPFPCSSLFPCGLSSSHVYLPWAGPLPQPLPGRQFLPH